MGRNISAIIDYKYTLRFVLVLIGFYYFNFLYLGVVTEGGIYYSLFLDKHLNYIRWLTDSLRYASSLLMKLFGLAPFLEGENVIRVGKEASVQVWLPCLGLGVMAAWIAYVFSRSTPLSAKLVWISGGLLLIWFINCIRIALLLVALNEGWQVNHLVNHHDLFNIVCYSMIVTLGYFYGKAPVSDRLEEL